MGYHPSSVPTCPRCGSPFPPTDRQCRNCGLTQEVAQDAFWRSSAPPPAGNPPQANGYPGQQPYYPAAQPVPPVVAPASDPFGYAQNSQDFQGPPEYVSGQKPKRSFWRSAGGLSLIAFLVLMVVGVSAFAIYYYPMLCSAQERNDLRNDLPLPCGITFIRHLDRSASGTTGPGSEEWVYKVDGQSPAQITSFYQDKLVSRGWTLPTAIQAASENHLAACQGQIVALINSTDKPATEGDFTFQPPAGGSLLLIILAPTKNLIQQVQEACASG